MARFLQLKRLNVLWIGVVMVVAIALMLIRPAISVWTTPHGNSMLYGKIADTRQWYERQGQDLVTNARVTINSIPPQTTHTDKQGQFWFKNLRDIRYTLEVDLPYDQSTHYSFVTQVQGRTGEFYDIGADEKHNLKEIDY